MRYRISGADSTSGREVALIVDVGSEKEATEEAASKGIFIASLCPEPGNGEPNKSPPSVQRQKKLYLLVFLWVTSLVATGGLVFVLATQSHGHKEQSEAVDPALEKYEMRYKKFLSTMDPFVTETRGLLGRMDAGISYNDYSNKVGDIAAAFASIDRSDDSPVNGVLIRAAEEAYESIKDVRSVWLTKIKYAEYDSLKDDSAKAFDQAFSAAGTKARVFLRLYDAAAK